LQRKNLDGHVEILNPLISWAEEPILNRAAELLRYRITSKAATSIALLSSAISFSLFLTAQTFRPALLLICPFILLHYIFDGTDGKIAKLRGEAKRHGYLIDKASDVVCSLFFVVGFTLFVRATPLHVVLSVTGALIIHLIYFTLFLWKGVDVKIGGTEGRIILMALCLKLFVST
jgi:phosphatidylglycerophosphate synthase